ncbi:MAG: hypothetical protein Q9218_005932 [Villophora microphyllina]
MEEPNKALFMPHTKTSSDGIADFQEERFIHETTSIQEGHVSTNNRAYNSGNWLIPPKKLRLSLLTPSTANDDINEKYDLDIIAVHGLNGHPRETWAYKESGREIYWLQEFLPKALPDARIYTFGYSAKAASSSSIGVLSDYATQLLDALQLQRQHSEVVSRESATVGVTHELVVPLDGKDHRAMCRMMDENELAYQIVVANCKGICTSVLDYARVLDNEEQACLNSLAMMNPNHTPDEGGSPAQNTCNWILEIQEFDKWRSGLPPLLWLSGEYGCGKTTLISFVRSRILDQPKAADSVNGYNKGAKISTVCGYSCGGISNHSMDGKTLLQGLIHDIIDNRHDLIHHATKTFKRSHPWSYERLFGLLKAILDDPRSKDLCIAIDALDECDDAAKIHQDLTEYLKKRWEAKRNPVTFIISSTRPTCEEVETSRHLISYLKLDVDKKLQDYITADILQFTRDELKLLLIDGRLFPRDDNNKLLKYESLAKLIADKSGGSFLWAALIVRKMKSMKFVGEAPEVTVEQFISTCPSNVQEMYSRTLKDVDEKWHKDVARSLHILLAAKRPLKLSEFKSAFALNNDMDNLDDLQREIGVLDEGVLSILRDSLSPLMKIEDYEGSAITLRHSSVRSFLLTSQDLQMRDSIGHGSEHRTWIGMSLSEAESTLTASCVRYLALEDFDRKCTLENDNSVLWEQLRGMMLEESTASPGKKTGSSAAVFEDMDRSNLEHPTPFLDYAAMHWGDHYASVNPASEDLALERLGPDVKYKAHLPLALTWAARMGRTKVVKLLLGYGATTTGACLERRSAFDWAVARGHGDIIDTLLEHNPRLVNLHDDDGHCPITLTVEYDHREVMQKLLITPNIDVNLQRNKNYEGTTAFLLAISAPDSSALARKTFKKLLQDPRVDITVRDKEGQTCLWRAACYGNTKAIQILLNEDGRKEAVDQLLEDVGPDYGGPNAKGDNKGISPLSIAVKNGHSDIVRLLCETKRISRQLESVDDRDEANAFYIAAKHGRADIIRILAHYHPKGVHSRDATGRTPLSTAMWYENQEVLRALVDHGANVNEPDKSGRTPVSYGTDHSEMVRVLVKEFNADINRPDNEGRTPISYGICKLGFVRVAVELGADINRPDKEGHSPLWYARNESWEMKEELRGLGAEMNDYDKSLL